MSGNVLSIYDPRSEEMQRLLASRNKMLLLCTVSFVITLLNGDCLKQKNKVRATLLATANTIWNLMGAQFTMSVLMQESVGQILGTLYPYMPYALTSKEYQALQTSKKNFAPYLSRLSIQDRNQIEEAINELQSRLLAGGSMDLRMLRSIILYLEDMQRFVAAKYSRFSFVREELPAIVQRIDSLLATYPQPIRAKLLEYLRPLLAKDILGKDHKPKSILFHGPSGVGKTMLAKRLFGDILGFNVRVTTAKEFLEKRGICNPAYFYYDPQRLTFLTNSMLQSNNKRKYTVIVIDEIDKQFAFDNDGNFIQDESYKKYMPELLELTEPNLTEYEAPDIQMQIDMSYVIFLLISNRNFLAKSPLQRRLEEFEFEAMAPELQQRIAHQLIDSLLKQEALTLDASQRAHLEHLIESNTAPGVANLLDEIKAYIDNLSSDAVFKDTSWGEYASPKLTL